MKRIQGHVFMRRFKSESSLQLLFLRRESCVKISLFASRFQLDFKVHMKLKLLLFKRTIKTTE